mgnify:CR=1 FL=1
MSIDIAMWLYLNDEDFASKIKSTQELKENYKNGYW